MLKTIIKKEILDSFLSFRFLFGTLLCLVLVPLGMYVNVKEYEQRLADYQESVRLYQARSEGEVYPNFEAEGFRPPSVLSIFALGLEYFLPNKAVTRPNGDFQVARGQGLDNAESFLFGKLDFLFNVTFVLSLLGLIFSFNSISGEKEEATLRLTMSNPVPRWQVILAKIVGSYTALLVPFLLSLLVGLIILNLSGAAPVFSENLLPTFILVLLVTLIFMFSVCNLGVLISALTHRSITSMVTVLFVWTVLVLSWPKVSPMIASIVDPVKSQQVHDFQKLLARQNLEKEWDRARRELFDKVITADFGLDFDALREGTGETIGKARVTYDTERQELDQRYEERITAEMKKLDDDYFNQRNTQSLIARTLSRISPISCYTYVVTELAGTGTFEIHNFWDNARRFQEQVKQRLYDKRTLRWYGSTKMRGAWREDAYVADFDPEKEPVPHLSYSTVSVGEALHGETFDIILLLVFSVIFFAASYVSFLRYDVR
jgi:ABC-type transport system involved in multi-copper enzyme maturation permease subunit